MHGITLLHSISWISKFTDMSHNITPTSRLYRTLNEVMSLADASNNVFNVSLVIGLDMLADAAGLGLDPLDLRRGLALGLKSPVLEPARIFV